MEEKVNAFLDALGPEKGAWLKLVLEQLEDVEDMFTVVWDIELAHQLFAPPMICRKSDPDAERIREEGNVLYRSGLYNEALHCYESSILLAAHPKLRVCDGTEINNDAEKASTGVEEDSDAKNASTGVAEGGAGKSSTGVEEDSNAENASRGEEEDSGAEHASTLHCEPECSRNDLKKYKTLPLAYANRSAAFMALRQYDNCLVDIDMALRFGYPEAMRGKLEERKERCLRAKEKTERSKPESDCILINKNIPPKLSDPNPSVPCFSSAIKVSYSPAKGKHVVATRDINPGELIAVEKSYCSNVLPCPDKKAYCQVCLMECLNKIPCPSCSLTVFCSDTCRAKGLIGHMRECKTLSVMYALDFEKDSTALLAMKLVVRTTYAELNHKVPLLNKESEELPRGKLGFDEKGIFRSSNYRTVYHMASGRTKKPAKDILSQCLSAFIITKALQQSEDFFVTKDGFPLRPYRKDFLLTGTSLLRHLIFSPPDVCLADIKIGKGVSLSEKEIVGTAIYPSLSLMRNSCNAPTVFYNYGHVKIVRTIMPVAAGEEMTLAFVGRYQCVPIIFRAIRMNMMGIKCSCEACIKFWPSQPDIPNEIKIKCILCGTPVEGTKKDPACADCGINFRVSNTRRKRNNNSTSIRKWWRIMEEVNQGVKKINQIHRKLETGAPVTKQEYNFTTNFSKTLTMHVQQPSMVFVLIRDILLSLFYKGM